MYDSVVGKATDDSDMYELSMQGFLTFKLKEACQLAGAILPDVPITVTLQSIQVYPDKVRLLGSKKVNFGVAASSVTIASPSVAEIVYVYVIAHHDGSAV